MRRPPTVTHGWPRPPRLPRAATFRFGDPPRFGLLRAGSGVPALLRAVRGAAANTNTTITRHGHHGGHIRAGVTPAQGVNIRAGVSPAQRTAEKRPPAQGEMEHVHDIYGGVFADRLDPGSA